MRCLPDCTARASGSKRRSDVLGVEIRPFVSLGPVWQLPVNNSPLFFELGISPTLLGGYSFNGRELGDYDAAFKRDYLAERMSAEEISEADRLANVWAEPIGRYQCSLAPVWAQAQMIHLGWSGD